MATRNTELTLLEIAASLELPVSTLRLYRDRFEAFVPAVGEGRRRRYDSRGVDALKRIADAKKRGESDESVLARLRENFAPERQARARRPDERLETLIALVSAQSEQLAALRAEVDALRKSLAAAEITATRRPLAFENISN